MNYISILLAKYHIFHKTFFYLRKLDVTCILVRLNPLNFFWTPNQNSNFLNLPVFFRKMVKKPLSVHRRLL